MNSVLIWQSYIFGYIGEKNGIFVLGKVYNISP